MCRAVVKYELLKAVRNSFGLRRTVNESSKALQWLVPSEAPKSTTVFVCGDYEVSEIEI